MSTENNADIDNSGMGTRRQAEESFLSAWDRYCAARQPKFVPTGRKAAKERDTEFRYSAELFNQAGAMYAWHLSNPIKEPTV